MKSFIDYNHISNQQRIENGEQWQHLQFYIACMHTRPTCKQIIGSLAVYRGHLSSSADRTKDHHSESVAKGVKTRQDRVHYMLNTTC